MPTKPIVDTTDSRAVEVGKEKVVVQRGAEPKPLAPELGPTVVEPMDFSALRTDKVELEKFMNEPVEVLVQEPMDELLGETWVVPLTVGVTTQRVFRGQPQKIKRKYVEVLARARKANVTARGYKDGTGEAVNEFRRSSRALEYPFQVLSDPSGVRGAKWLQSILRNEL